MSNSSQLRRNNRWIRVSRYLRLEPMLEKQFGFGEEVATLTISLFVAGYCVGPLVWGPLSESFGRKPVFVVTFIIYTGFQVGCALAQDTAQILVFRFLGGTFAAAPLANSGCVFYNRFFLIRTGQRVLTAIILAPSSRTCGTLMFAERRLLCSRWPHLRGPRLGPSAVDSWRTLESRGAGCFGC